MRRLITGLKTFLAHPVYRGLELFTIALVLPTWIIVQRQAPYMFNFLWGTAIYCVLVHRLLYTENFRTLWKWEAVRWSNLRPVLLRWLLLSLAMGLLAMLAFPDKFLGLVSRDPQFILLLFLLYPLLSALPQEFIFCTFIFRRYRCWFGEGRLMILISSLIFAYAHVLFINWVAPVLSFLAGLIFARTYATTRSLALVSIEHGLYGNVLFFWGLGWFFYGGSVR